MLERIRTIQNTWIGKAVVAVIMGLIMISFVIWGIGPVFTGFNANTLATVGGDTVTVDSFRQAYQSELQQLQQRLRRPVTNAQAHQYGLDSQVLARLVSDAVLDAQAHGLGLAIGQDQIAKAITGDQTFAGPDGKFDRARFNELLRQNDMTEATFVREQRNVYLRQELIQALVGGLQAPQAAVDALHALATETRSIDTVVLPKEAAGDIPGPDEATLQKFFDDRAGAFRAPEYRKLVILPLLPATLAKPEDVADADVQALYDRVKGERFTTPEYRTLQQIVFPNEAEAGTAAAALKAGTTFDALAAERKLTDKDIAIGRVTQAGTYDPGVAAAAFALPEGGVSDPVKTPFGTALVRVTAIEPGTTKPLEAVAAALKLEIAAGRTGNAIRTLHDKVEDARASGQSLAEAAKAAGVEVRTIEAVVAEGRGKDGQTVDLPDGPALLKAAFASDIGVDNDTIRTPEGGQVFFEVAAIEAARPKTLAEVRPAVEAAWRTEETGRRLAAKAEELVKAIDAGKSLEDVAREAGLPVGHVGDVRRGGGTGLPPGVVARVFDTPVNGAGSAASEGDTRTLFKVLGTVVPALEPDSAAAKELADQYQAALADGLVTTYLGQVQGRLGVKINPAAFSAVTGGS